MEMQGQRQLAVTQQQAWDALNDPEVLKACIAGCDKLEATGPNAFAVGVALKIGPVSAKFAGNIQLSDVQAPHSYQLTFDGSGGAAGFGKGISKVVLEPNDQGTMLNYTVSAQVGGKIAQMGQRLIDGVAKSMAEDFFGKFEGVLNERFSSATVNLNVVKADDPAATAPGPGMPRWVWFAGAVIAGVVGYFILRAK
jgi:uncharacterized protein